MLKELALVFPPGRYTWFIWGKTSAMYIRSKAGRSYILLKGAEFGVRPATSKKGMYRVITRELGPSIIFSMDQNQVNKLTKNSTMASVETAKQFHILLFSRVNAGKYVKTITIDAKDEKEAERLANEEYPLLTPFVTTTKKMEATVEVAASDKKILDFLTNNLMIKLDIGDIKHVRFTRVSPKTVQLFEDFDGNLPQFPFILFREGSKESDSYAGLGKIGLSLGQFVQWLQKHGALEKKKVRQKRQRNFVLYD